jgi:hypothetical protein
MAAMARVAMAESAEAVYSPVVDRTSADGECDVKQMT